MHGLSYVPGPVEPFGQSVRSGSGALAVALGVALGAAEGEAAGAADAAADALALAAPAAPDEGSLQ
jgi:hypothetical protein